MRTFFVLLLFFTSSFTLKAQGVFINYDLAQSPHDLEAALNLWTNFLACEDDVSGSNYWSVAEVEKFGDDAYFLVEKELDFGTENYLGLLKKANVTVLSVQKIEGVFKITSEVAFAHYEGSANVQYIFHVYAQEEQGELKLFNAFELNRELFWQSETVDEIRFNFPKHHTFDRALAEKQVDFLHEISTEFNVPLVDVDYYFAPTKAEINALRGFDFLVGSSGIDLPSGKADPENRIVYSTGLGEYYPHEFMHILVSPHYPNCHLWIDEGMATYFGMARGKSLDWHLNKLALHLEQHPELDLSNMLQLRTMDVYTDYRYVIGGWLIQKAMEKGGINLVKTLMESGTTDEDLYTAIETHLGMARENLNTLIRADLKR